MPSQITTREFRADDYEPAVELWQQSEGIEIAEGDERATITRYLERNPGLSRVAVRDHRIVGAVLCGHDGRRGLLYHLAVSAEERGRGVGRLLVEECLAGLRACEIKRALILVADANTRGREFWVDCGFAEISRVVPHGADL